MLDTPAVVTTYYCPPGTYSSQGGAFPSGTCVACGTGAYANFPGQTNCRLLPTDATNVVGGAAAPALGYYDPTTVRSRTYTTWEGSTATTRPASVLSTFPGYSSCDPRLIMMDLKQATNDFVAMGTFAFGSPFSVVFWLQNGNPDSSNANVFSFGNLNSAVGSIRFMHNLDTRLAMWVSDTTGMSLSSLFSALTMEAGQFYFFGLVWDNMNQRLVMYRNGQILGAYNFPKNTERLLVVANLTRQFHYLGRALIPGDNTPGFTGKIGGFRVYSRALSAAEVQRLQVGRDEMVSPGGLEYQLCLDSVGAGVVFDSGQRQRRGFAYGSLTTYTPCPPGSSLDSGVCVSCPVGMYSHLPDSPSCALCPYPDACPGGAAMRTYFLSHHHPHLLSNAHTVIQIEVRGVVVEDDFSLSSVVDVVCFSLCLFMVVLTAFPVQYPTLMQNKETWLCTGDISANNFSAVGLAISFVNGGAGIQLPIGPVFGLPFCFHAYLFVRQVFTGSSEETVLCWNE